MKTRVALPRVAGPRVALPEDLAQIRELIDRYSNEGMLLPRNLADLRAHLGGFIVLAETTARSAELNGAVEKILGCVSLENYGADLAEIRSLAVAPEAWRRRLGGKLLETALAAARHHRIARVFAVTHAPRLFKRHGFIEMPRQALPEKVARDCHKCHKAADCELVAVIAVVCPDRSVLPLAPRGERALPIL